MWCHGRRGIAPKAEVKPAREGERTVICVARLAPGFSRVIGVTRSSLGMCARFLAGLRRESTECCRRHAVHGPIIIVSLFHQGFRNNV
jgi:hypothetical protein